VHDKQIRRRRAVLALLVVVSLVLLTDYFGSPSSSPLHSVQRGIAEVLSPIQDGASKVLSPVRDVAGWFSSTFKAKSEAAEYKAKYNKLVGQYAALQAKGIEGQRAIALLKLDDDYNLNHDGLVAANVIGKNLDLWYETVTIDKGSDDGVRPNDPVVAGGGLVGDIAEVTPDESVVTLLTSPKFSVGAMIENTVGTDGLIQPAIADPTSLRLNSLPTSAQVSTGQLVVTSDFVDTSPGQRWVHSLYPRGIPIGTVSSADATSSVQTSAQVDVTPSVDFTDLNLVQILTKPHGG
jgi:rod shape-determining protein MreC